ncbi:MAG: glycosyltransferase 87 family protein [Patescibacteria group bacterium]
MIKKLFFILSILILVFLGFQQRWYDTLSGDLRNVYFPLAQTHLPGISIYPPGANLFFMLLPSNNLQIFQWAFIIVNILLLIIIAKLTKKPALLALIILAAGPILLFRFDLLVMLLVVVAIISFQRNNFYLSAVFLGIATITKLFPIILLPYFLFTLNRRKILPYLLFFILPIAVISLIYSLVTGQDLLTILNKANGAFTVSVHVESVMATVLTTITAVTNPGPHGLLFKDALWSLDPLYFLGHARIFKFITPIVIAVTYFLIYLKQKTFEVRVCLLIILTLIISSQLLSPQYVVWPAILFLLIDKPGRLNIILILLILFLTQLIYPLNYGEFLDFYNKGINLPLFLILAARNLTLVILTLRLFVNVISSMNNRANDIRRQSRMAVYKKCRTSIVKYLYNKIYALYPFRNYI